jgi:NodT family efflux transporter outer membrane factor (OMF) lipoprotein
VLVGVLGEVGWTYLELRGAQRRLDVAREHLGTQEQTAVLTRDRHAAGLTSELDTARAEAQVAFTRAQIPPLEEACQRALHRLGVLVGGNPGGPTGRPVGGAGQPGAVPRVPVGLPSDLLRQRPDIRRAERELAAASARVGVATAELFPRFFLTGVAGLESVAAEDFAMGASRFWSLGPGVRWPVFTAGRIRRQIQAADARHEQALLRYEQVILLALEEVENALVAFGREQERRGALAASEVAARRSVALATERYRGGLVDFLDVLEAERSLLAVQDSLATSDQRLGQQLVQLYRALGGGWAPEVMVSAGGMLSCCPLPSP